MKKHETLSMWSPGEHPDEYTLDRWRAGLLSGDLADGVATHVKRCSYCRSVTAFAPNLVSAWASLELPATVRRTIGAERRRPIPWFRGAVAGFILTLATLLIGLHLSIPGSSESDGNPNRVTAPAEQEVVAHLGFYEWLNAHPDRLQQVDHGF